MRRYVSRKVVTGLRHSRRICGLAKGVCRQILSWKYTPLPSNSSRRLDLTAPTRHLGDRKLLREGLLHKAKSGRKLRAFLCSDILLLTDEYGKTLYRMVRA